MPPNRTSATLSPHREPPRAAPPADPYRVMVVDDSAVIRGLLVRALEAEPMIRVAATAANGSMAVSSIAQNAIDVVVLDIEMPVMDGITALPRLLAASPRSRVIMASTLTTRNADISMRALAAGAADYIAKPTSTRELNGAQEFNRDLIAKVMALGQAARRGRPPARPATPETVREPRVLPAGRPVALRPLPSNFRPDLFAIGSSTGGPQALFAVLPHLKGVAQPIVITQHMPATFTTLLAEHIIRQCGIPTAEARDGETLAGGRCYIAPGNFHMAVESRAAGLVVRLNQAPPENFCRPAVDVMLRSIVAARQGANTLAVILTGMGQDGLKGSREIVQAGGAVLAQDEETSVVWGMPGAVAGAGLCSAVLPLPSLGPQIRKFAR